MVKPSQSGNSWSHIKGTSDCLYFIIYILKYLKYYSPPCGLLYSDVAPSLFSEDIDPSSDDKDPASEDVSEVWVTTSPEINSFVTVSLISLILPP